MRPRLTTAHRASIFLGLGTVLATGVAAPGCTEPEPTSNGSTTDAATAKGVRTTVAEVEPGQYVIEDEAVVDSATKVIVRRLDGTRETIATPEAFAALLPLPDKFAADTLAASKAAVIAAAAAKRAGGDGASVPVARADSSSRAGGAGAGYGPEDGQRNGQNEGQGYRSGFPLGSLLFYSLAMNAWRPAGYGAYGGRAPAYAYRDDGVRNRSSSAGGTFSAFQRRGLAPTGAASASAFRSRGAYDASGRAVSPSRGQSGYGRTFGRGAGG